MAVIYKAIQEPLDREVAIKALKPSIALDSQFAARFEREARFMASLQHENILHVYDFVKNGNSLYIVMEYVQGIDLYDLLQLSPRLPIEVAAIIALQVARALDYAHFRGIIHRDIKPANIMLDADGGDAVKLIDFGIAVREHGLALMAPRVVGTPAYMAPEQASGAHGSRASDLYALGALALELLTGRPPYTYPSIQRVVAAVSVEPPAMPSSRGVFISGLDAFFARALARDPRRRFRSASELVDALENVLCSAPKLVAVRPARSMKARAWRWIRSALSGSSDALARVA